MSHVKCSDGWLALVLALFSVIAGQALSTGPAWGQDSQKQPGWHLWGPGEEWRRGWHQDNMSPRHRHRMQRHWIFMNGNIPARFQNLKNPFGDNEDAIKQGESIYSTNCAQCHGTEGLGEGEAGNDLYPSPALLAFMIQMPIAVDSYLMWTISEGGEAFNTGMPAFKEKLNDEDIWRVITYLRNGFALP